MAFGNTFLARWSRLYAHNTPSEMAIEPAIAALGVPYRAQHPVFACGAVVDFAWPGRGLVLEVDGKEHRTARGREKDALRTRRLNGLGWRVLRCTNEEALADPDGTVRRLIKPALENHP